jgi:hypothetical protein
MGALAALVESTIVEYKLTVKCPASVQEPTTKLPPTPTLHPVIGLLLVGLRVIN